MSRPMPAEKEKARQAIMKLPDPSVKPKPLKPGQKMVGRGTQGLPPRSAGVRNGWVTGGTR
jgi:hypothetical protein